MQINIYDNTSFQAKFVNNKAMQEVVKYASEHNYLQTLDHALNKLAQYNKGDIVIFHGEINNKIYSNFSVGRKGIQNLVGKAKSPAEASFESIIKLSAIGAKFRQLFGKPKVFLNETDVLAKLAK